MSVKHSAVPFSDELRRDDVLAWLGFEIPDDVRIGRYPTPNELRDVMNHLQGYSVEFQVGPLYWIANVSNEYPVLAVEAVAFSGSPDQSQEFRFSGDRDVLTQILRRLPEDCGTFLVMTEGEDPEFITAGDSAL